MFWVEYMALAMVRTVSVSSIFASGVPFTACSKELIDFRTASVPWVARLYPRGLTNSERESSFSGSG